MTIEDQPTQIIQTADEHRFILEEIIKHRDRDGLHEWIELTFGVYIPRVKVCDDHDAPFDFICDYLFNEFQEALVLANRSGGKTYDFAILDTIVSFLHSAIEVATIGAILPQAKRCYGYVSDYLDKQPFASNVEKKTMEKTKFINKSSVEVLVGTMSGVNSPHPQAVFIDEIDLMAWQILQQALSMPQSKNGFTAKTVLTSTRKFPNAGMQKMLDTAEERESKVYKWCIWEVVEKLPTHDPKLMNRITDTFGATLPKHIDKADGYYTWPDTIKKYKTLDSEIWAAEWLCIKPGTEGIIYGSAYSDERNLTTGWKLSEQVNGTVYLFEDFGYGKTHPDVILFAWLAPDYSKLVIFDELYIEQEGTDAIWNAVVERLAEYELEVSDVLWVPDYHGLTEIADRVYRGAIMLDKVEESENYKVLEGVAMVRKLLEAKLLQITDKCVNLRSEILSYRRKKNLDGTFSLEPKKVDDHGPDALRYGVIQLFQLMIQYLVDKMEESDGQSDDSDSEKGKSITAGLYGKTF